MKCILHQVDELFGPEKGNPYSLSIVLRQDGFSVLAADPASNRMLALADYLGDSLGRQFYAPEAGTRLHDEYFDFFKNSEFIKDFAGEVSVAIASPRFTVLPQHFSENENGRAVMNFTQTVAAGDEIITDVVFEKGPAVQLAVPGLMLSRIREIFPSARIYPEPGMLIEGLMRSHSLIIARQIFVNLYSDFVEITVIQGMRLLYFNAFSYKAPSDVLYYLIFVLEQIGFEPSAEEINLLGYIEKGDAVYEQLAIYCGKLTFAESASTPAADSVLPGIKLHTYFSLLSLASCG